MSTETRLKPCPFCGGAARELNRFNANVITCRRCGVKVRQSEMGQGDAAEQWNKRFAPVSAEPVALPQCPFPCGWSGLHKIAVQDAAYLAKVQWPEDEEGVNVPRATAMRSMDYLIQVCRTMLNAAPVTAQPDLTQQTLDDVKAGIPARDAEIEALHKEIEALQAAQPRRLIFPTMLRKMWSGSEVQTWLDDELAKLTKSSSQQTTDHDEVQL